MSIIDKKIKERFKSLFFMEYDDVTDIKSDEAMVIAIDYAIHHLSDIEVQKIDYDKDLENKLIELKKLKTHYEDIGN